MGLLDKFKQSIEESMGDEFYEDLRQGFERNKHQIKQGLDENKKAFNQYNKPKFCSICGNKLGPNDAFCTNCGTDKSTIIKKHKLKLNQRFNFMDLNEFSEKMKKNNFCTADIMEIRKEYENYVREYPNISDDDCKKYLYELIEKQCNGVSAYRYVDRIIGEKGLVNLKITPSFRKKLFDKGIPFEENVVHQKVIKKIQLKSYYLNENEVRVIIDECIEEVCNEKKIELEIKKKEEEKLKREKERIKREEEERLKREEKIRIKNMENAMKIHKEKVDQIKILKTANIAVPKTKNTTSDAIAAGACGTLAFGLIGGAFSAAGAASSNVEWINTKLLFKEREMIIDGTYAISYSEVKHIDIQNKSIGRDIITLTTNDEIISLKTYESYVLKDVLTQYIKYGSLHNNETFSFDDMNITFKYSNDWVNTINNSPLDIINNKKIWEDMGLCCSLMSYSEFFYENNDYIIGVYKYDKDNVNINKEYRDKSYKEFKEESFDKEHIKINDNTFEKCKYLIDTGDMEYISINYVFSTPNYEYCFRINEKEIEEELIKILQTLRFSNNSENIVENTEKESKNSSTNIDDLMKCAELYKEGLLTKEEFEVKKKELL